MNMLQGIYSLEDSILENVVDFSANQETKVLLRASGLTAALYAVSPVQYCGLQSTPETAVSLKEDTCTGYSVFSIKPVILLKDSFKLCFCSGLLLNDNMLGKLN